ncbi:MAG: type II secretion system protein [Pseudomonadota bacterium]
MRKQNGFTLIELTLFITIMSFLGVGILSAFYVSLHSAPDIQNSARASELAQQRMELIVGSKEVSGFASTVDPCVASPGLAVCAAPAGFTVSSNIVGNWGGNANYKDITVTVSGDGSATLERLVANY